MIKNVKLIKANVEEYRQKKGKYCFYINKTIDSICNQLELLDMLYTENL